MNPVELQLSIREKIRAFESALEAGKPHQELLAIYKEIKELQYQLAQLNLELTT